MKLDHPFLQLPLSFDAAVLAAEIARIDESEWRPHPQGYPGNSALTLISVGGNPDSDEVRGEMKPTRHLLACPYLMQAMQSMGAVWGRSRLMRLAGQAEVTSHVDINYYWREHTRVHVPIVTQPTVRFVCGDADIHMAAGECWTFDTWRRHHVHNDDERARIHLVADTVGGASFRRLLRASRPHDVDVQGWQTRRISPGASTPTLEYEKENVPLVMTPWEVREHIAFLLGESEATQQRQRMEHDVLQPFMHEWHASWAKHGQDSRGFSDYRVLRDGLRASIAQYADLRLHNGVRLVQALQAIVVANLVATDTTAQPVFRSSSPGGMQAPLAPGFGSMSIATSPATGSGWSASPRGTPAGTPRTRIDRPLILLSAPRSGSTLLFETLSQAPELFTIGHESHRLIEGLPGLHPSSRGWESNRLHASDATQEVAQAVRSAFAHALRDRNGKPPPPGAAVRLLEKTPKNILRVPFLRTIFPDARFVYLSRDPRAVLASMMEAWQSGRFRTYADLPGWKGPPWSLLLVPGWQGLIDRPLEEVVAAQWATATAILLQDLVTLPRDTWCWLRYEDLIASPDTEVRRLCAMTGVEWDREVWSLPLSRHTLTPPDPQKWRRHEAAIERVWPTVEPVWRQAQALLAPSPG